MSRFRNYLNYTNDPRCDACWAKDLCMGGCPLPQRSRVERQHCDLMKYSTELAIAVFAMAFWLTITFVPRLFHRKTNN